VQSWLVEDIIDLEEKAGLSGCTELLRLVSRVVSTKLSGTGIGVTDTVGFASFLK
jgi:hypothetical protein